MFKHIEEANRLQKSRMDALYGREENDIQKGGPGSGRKKIKDHSQYKEGEHELEVSSAYGDLKYNNRNTAKSAYYHQADQQPKGGTALVSMHDGSHLVTSNARASIFEKQGSGKIIPLTDIEKGGVGSGRKSSAIANQGTNTAIYHNKATGETHRLGGVRDLEHAWNLSDHVSNKMGWNKDMFHHDVKVSLEKSEDEDMNTKTLKLLLQNGLMKADAKEEDETPGFQKLEDEGVVSDEDEDNVKKD